MGNDFRKYPLARGPRTLHRSAVTANDSDFPTAVDGVPSGAIDCSQFDSLDVDIKLGGTTPTWNVTPGYYDPTSDTWYRGDTVTVSANSKYCLQTNGWKYVYLLCDSQTGTSPEISIYVQPLNAAY